MDEYIKKDDVWEYMRSQLDMQDEYLPKHFMNFVIDKMPAADVRENVKGEWVEYSPDYETAFQCSICGQITLGAKQYDLRGNEYVYEYCPHCGADLREKDNDEKI